MPRRDYATYWRLTAYLATQPPAVTEVVLPLDTIAQFVSGPLPPRAWTTAWWAHSQTARRLWRALGWQARLDQPARTVTFARTTGDPMLRYRPYARLLDYLAAVPSDQSQVTLRLADLEALLQRPLHFTARGLPEFWTTSPTARKNWRAAGWTGWLNGMAQTVTFTRAGDGRSGAGSPHDESLLLAAQAGRPAAVARGGLDDAPQRRGPTGDLHAEEAVTAAGGRSKYAPLLAYLMAQPADVQEVVLSLDAIALLVGGALPATAGSPEFWRAGVYARSLPRPVGWRARLNHTTRMVTFTRPP